LLNNLHSTAKRTWPDYTSKLNNSGKLIYKNAYRRISL